MNLQYETINFEVIENIAIIRLNRPNSYNSLNAKMAKELLEISFECDTNKKIRAIILTGEGEKAFCAGGDLKSFHETGNIGKHLKTWKQQIGKWKIEKKTWFFQKKHFSENEFSKNMFLKQKDTRETKNGNTHKNT